MGSINIKGSAGSTYLFENNYILKQCGIPIGRFDKYYNILGVSGDINIRSDGGVRLNSFSIGEMDTSNMCISLIYYVN